MTADMQLEAPRSRCWFGFSELCYVPVTLTSRWRCYRAWALLHLSSVPKPPYCISLLSNSHSGILCLKMPKLGSNKGLGSHERQGQPPRRYPGGLFVMKFLPVYANELHTSGRRETWPSVAFRERAVTPSPQDICSS